MSYFADKLLENFCCLNVFVYADNLLYIQGVVIVYAVVVVKLF